MNRNEVILNSLDTLSALTPIIEKITNGQEISDDNVELVKSVDNNLLIDFKNSLLNLILSYKRSYSFILSLSKGDLHVDPPKGNSYANHYKQLHSDLLHLTWQIQRISEGDYNQKVSFSGDFSRSINRMVESLKERDNLAKLNEQYLSELSELNMAKNRLFSIIGHDLKNPFTGILGFSDLLLDHLEVSNDDDMAYEYAQIIKKQAQSGYKLLVDLLDWAKSQSDKIIIDYQEISISDVIDQALSVNFSVIDKKGVKVFLGDSISGEKIYSDRQILFTLLRNIINNAVKYSFINGEIEINCSENDKYLILEIKDYGVGIPEDRQNKIFDTSYKYSSPGTCDEEGTGLGLIMCKDLVKKIGGTIHFKSKIGSGTSFFISLPNKEDYTKK